MLFSVRSRPALLVTSLALAVVALAGCGSKPAESGAPDQAAAPTTASGDGEAAAVTTAKVLNFSATTVTGAAFDGSSLAGKPAVLWFWAPWCPTCRAQIAGVSALAEKYGAGVNFVGVGSLDKSAAIKGFAEAVPAKFPELQDPDGKVWRHFGITEQSTYVVLDANGKLVKQGYLSDSDLKDAVAKLAG